MDEFRQPPPGEPPQLRVEPPRRSPFDTVKKVAGPVIGVVLLLFTKFKFVIFGIVKFLPAILKTGGTMILSIWVYAMNWGWMYAVGFVVLIFIHECGHLVVARKFGLKVGAPVFIPFMGALIALKDAPKDAWMEAWVGIGGPIFGTLGAGACYALYPLTGNPLFLALAYTGFMLNLFNMIPIGFLDGGRIATALSPWLWVVGVVGVLWLLYVSWSFLLLLIFIVSLPRLFSLFRRRTEAEQRYYEVTPARRWIMGILYFGLIGILVVGMERSHIPVQGGF